MVSPFRDRLAMAHRVFEYLNVHRLTQDQGYLVRNLKGTGLLKDKRKMHLRVSRRHKVRAIETDTVRVIETDKVRAIETDTVRAIETG